MPIQLNSRGWRIRPDGVSRSRTSATSPALPGLPPEFLPGDGAVVEDVILEPAAPARSREAAAASPVVDIDYEIGPGEAAALVIRHASGALTFHAPAVSTSRGSRGQLRFQVPIRQRATRGVVDAAIKAIVVKVAKTAVDKAVSVVLPKTVEAIERAVWNRSGLREGWFKVTKETLKTKRLEAAVPTSGARSLLLIHGTFSDAASAYGALADSAFFDRLRPIYGDRIFAFNHFSLCRTPRENARMLLEALPASGVSFDVITHSRGGLVLRELAERAQFNGLEKRLRLGHAVLVAAPNDGTPLATPRRWEDTLGTFANVLELLPDNPFSTLPALISNGMVWLATHAVVDIPGLSAMDANGEAIETLQARASTANSLSYSALVANYQPDASTVQRLIDAGIDQFFGSANDLVVPAEGGWRIGRSSKPLIPAARIGCFGPGGNLDANVVTHVGFFSRAETVDFLVNALDGREQPLRRVDPMKALPDHRVGRGTATTAAAATAGRGSRTASAARPAALTPPLQVAVVNGNLTYVPEPLLLGHYRSSRLTGTELVMDRLLRNELGQALAVGLYPERIGSHQIFVNTHPDFARGTIPRPAAVIIAGLGEEGRLKGPHLVQTVKQAVIAWSQSRHATQQGKTQQPRPATTRRSPAAGAATSDHALAATLIGSGGTEIGPGEAARLIVQGVCEANDALSEAGVGWPRVNALRLIELYMDRASEAWRALRLQLDARNTGFSLAPTVTRIEGGLARPADAGYRGADYDFVSVQTTHDERGQTVLSYTLDTRRARSEVRAQRTQSRLLRDLIATASNDRDSDEQIRRTLFNLLVPIELEAYLAGSGQMMIELDPQTAGVPWELLDTRLDGQVDDKPWGVRVTLLRKLKVQNFRERVVDADADAHALVIGEPECSADYPRLAGAREEAQAVAQFLKTQLPHDAVQLLCSDALTPGPSARTVLNALFDRAWRILHISGHGVPPSRQSEGGVVLSNGSFLGAAEIASLRTTPELVFVNCCHLAASDGGALLNAPARTGQFDRARFASGVAGSLIDVGVRCVIAAGWAVDDRVARVFAETFYARVLENRTFIEAVAGAREAAWLEDPRGNTWAAYQCYGDPDWRLRPANASDGAGGATSGAGRTPADNATHAIASLQQLKLLLEQITIQSRSNASDSSHHLVARREEFLRLEQLFANTFKGRADGSVLEALAAAAVEVGELERGIAWYERAVRAADAQASLKSAEQLANVRARWAWERVNAAAQQRDELSAAVRSAPRGRAGNAARQAAAAAERRLAAAVRTGPRDVSAALKLLKQINAVQPTAERMSLIGSAHKRLALIHLVGGKRHVGATLTDMRNAYATARELAVQSGKDDPAYGALNSLLFEVLNSMGSTRAHSLGRTLVHAVKVSNERQADANFWTMVAAMELRQYEAVAGRRLAAAVDSLTRGFETLHTRVSARHRWASVYDTVALLLHSYTRALTRAAGGRKAKPRVKGEIEAARTLLELLRGFAHPPA